MIIFKIQESGEATDFMLAEKCPAGWKSIDGDKIPEDISKYHEQKYIDLKALENQEQTLLNLIKKNEYHLIDGRHDTDKTQWKAVLKIWYSQLEEVKTGKLVEIEPVPIFD